MTASDQAKEETSIDDAPPSVERLVEAMLFVGGGPLSAKRVCAILRGVAPEEILQTVAALNRQYKKQNRPYRIQSRPDGCEMVLLPRFRHLGERLFGSFRESRLSSQSLDTLALVAYRQPISRHEIDALRGNDSAAILRQLVRLGLISLSRGKEDARLISYSTTRRFLNFFQLNSLDDLPRHQDLGHL
ncbi:MAG: SMC-Scp complex subunit ScpB [Gemmataceae bacterium]|nr:SMC-Scp complex subunit ScpB [Gemmataceae bacterium]